MKTIIVGGVAAGASAAARLRRLDESMEIVLLEKGPHVSYANCGLPYHLGGAIPERNSLLVMSERKFRSWFNIDVRTENEATALDRARRTVRVRRKDGTEYEESYDKLLLATGARPSSLNLPGSDDPRIHPLWTIPDMDALIALAKGGAKKALVIGGGFIGLEAAENLRERGLEVVVVQHSDHVLPSVDKEIAWHLENELASMGIELRLNATTERFRNENGRLIACLQGGEEIPADLVVASVGAKPNSDLAKNAGLEIGARGHIVVDEHLRTSDPDVYAAGDVIEVVDGVSGGKTAIPLAGPANKQGRIAADNIAGGSSVYRASYGASVIKIGNLAAAAVGLTETKAKRLGLRFHKIYTHPASNASYYPGGSQMHMKLLFDADGRILGAQAVGPKGSADKRIDAIAVAMESGQTAPELAELELAYAPPFNSAKDPVNFLGMIAQNVLSGKTDLAHADALPENALVIDVREPAERDAGFIPGSINLPLGEIRERLSELDRSRDLIVSCQVGLRGYLAERILKQNGFRVRNLSGGYLTWKSFHAPLSPVVRSSASSAPQPSADEDAREADAQRELDVRALACPGPVTRLKETMDSMKNGETLRLRAASTFAPDLEAWSRATGNAVLTLFRKNAELEAVLRKGGAESAAAKGATENDSGGAEQGAIILFSNDFDKAMAALILACGMASSGMKTCVFFTFWGLSVLRKNPAPAGERNLISKMFGFMLPKGADRLPLSKMNMGGLGAAMMKRVMKEQGAASLPELIRNARALGVRFIACEMAMNVMGFRREDLIEVDEVAGVASFVENAKGRGPVLFI